MTRGRIPVDRIFTSGVIRTMERRRPLAEAVAVGGGRIVAVGTRHEVLAMRGPATEVVDLSGATVLPGFVDGHGHIAGVTASLGQANLSAPPVGAVNDLDGLVGALRRFIRDRAIPAGTWVQGRGYDPAFLAEGRHPTRADLDAVSREHPIYVVHVSGHLAAVNSLGLEMAGYDATTPDPPGGAIRRGPGGEPDGVLEESAIRPFTTLLIPPPTADEQRSRFAAAQRAYLAEGITTAQEGGLFPPAQAMLELMADEGLLDLDVVAYPFWLGAEAMLEGREVGVYRRRLKYGGVKLMLDGSPQGKTAWLTRPYQVPPPGHGPDYCGYPAMPSARVEATARLAFARGWQVLAHCNGDAAADAFIAAVRAAAGGADAIARRPVMIHAQTVREDQLDAMAELGILPSFFASHVYYWGDYHRDSVLGPERAARISPLRSALRRGIRLNLHNDAPVVPPDIRRLVWCAVARRTRSGAALGADQAIDVEAALRAVTIDAAYAHFEEGDKGSIAPGKLADLVVLGADPCDVDEDDIPTIPVLATVKEGVTVYAAGEH